MDNYLKTADGDWYRLRLNRVVYWVMAAFVVLVLRLFHLQVLEGQEFRRLSENNCIRLQSIEPSRGLIFDRNGKMLVDNRPSFDVGITLKDAKPVPQTLARLSTYLDVPREALSAALNPENGLSLYRPVVLTKDIGRDALAAVAVRKFELPGVDIHVRALRHYLDEKSLAHLIGYMGEVNSAELQHPRYKDCRSGDLVGKFGVEKVFEEQLRGSRGGRQVEVNARGEVVRVLKTVPAAPGRNLYLTIDQRLQREAEKALAGKVGAIVALDPGSGEILALASAPSFDQNAFVSGLTRSQWDALISNPFRPMENKGIQGEYPPASTYKIVTAAAGLEEKVIDAHTTIHCPGFYRMGGRDFRCWKKGGHGSVDVLEAIEQSCDVFFYQVGLKLGVDRLAWYAKAFGLGEPTGAGLDGEASGLVPSTEWKRRRFNAPWHAGETLSVAIGQGYNLATPLQMAVLTAAVANGGVRYRPFLLKEIRTAENEPFSESHPNIAGRVPLSPRTLELVREGLRRVVNGSRGTARASKLDWVDISGKTGTAQVVGRKSGEARDAPDVPHHHKDHAWFVAYAPSQAPQIALAILIEHGEHGSSAAPIARDLIDFYLKRDERPATLMADGSGDRQLPTGRAP